MVEEKKTKKRKYTKSKPKGLLTAREKRFVKKVVQTGNITQSALSAGFADRCYGSVLMRKEAVREAILKCLEKEGITTELIAKKLREGLDATHPKRFSAKGTLIQDSDPDYFNRGIYLDRCLKLAGFEGGGNEFGDNMKPNQITIVITPELTKALVDAEVIDVEEVKQLPVLQKEEMEGEKHA